jgi:hypothetical protein
MSVFVGGWRLELVIAGTCVENVDWRSLGQDGSEGAGVCLVCGRNGVRRGFAWERFAGREVEEEREVNVD